MPVVRGFTALALRRAPPGPPDEHAEDPERFRQHEQRQRADPHELLLRELEARGARTVRPDRDRLDVAREPVDAVEEEIPVAIGLEQLVGREVRIAEDDEARGLRFGRRLRPGRRRRGGVREVDRARDGDGHRAPEVVAIELGDGLGEEAIEIGLRPRVVAGEHELRERRFRVRSRAHAARDMEERRLAQILRDRVGGVVLARRRASWRGRTAPACDRR